MKEKFPFVVRGPTDKLRKVEADTYPHALDKVLALNPDHFITTTFARNVAGIKIQPLPVPVQVERKKNQIFKLIINTMDLQTARAEAAKQSKETKKKLFINIDGEGECIIESVPSKQADLVQAAFVNGKEVPLEVEIAATTATNAKLAKKNKSINNKTPKEATIKMAKTAKKSAKKSAKPAKKVAAKKIENEFHKDAIAKATTLRLSQTQWNNLYKKVETEGSIQHMCVQALIKTYGI